MTLLVTRGLTLGAFLGTSGILQHGKTLPGLSAAGGFLRDNLCLGFGVSVSAGSVG